LRPLRKSFASFSVKLLKNEKMKKNIVLLFIIVQFGLYAQTNPNDYKKVDETIRGYTEPVDHKTSVAKVARFIYENFDTETDRLRAAFVWIADHFDYDVENMFNLKSYSDPQELLDEMLKNKKGVCMHYAYLFNEIAGNLLGIKTYTISGFTKQEGVINSVSHVWCVSFADSAWHLIDPTWGAGYVLTNNMKYVRSLNNDYFDAAPEKLVQSHHPYDPLWQFLHYPVSAQEFYDGNTEINEKKLFFNYLDTLAAYENATKMEQLLAVNRRIVQNGVKNALTRNQLETNEQEIEFYKQQIAVDFYNVAVNYYNDGVNFLNTFIYYRNDQFKPEKPETEIRKMIEDAENALHQAQTELQKVVANDAGTKSMVRQLQVRLQDAVKKMTEQKIFVNRYFDTAPLFRKSLFRQY
jgi:hypothetical protein